MQIDLVPKLPTSGGYESIVTAMDVFFHCLFAYPTSNQDAKTIAKFILNIMTKHANLPTTLILYQGSAFVSHVIKNDAGVHGITLKHATTRQAQTIGLLKRSHAPIKQVMNVETGERRSFRHKYVSVSVLRNFLSHNKDWLCAKQSFSLMYSLQYLGFEIRNSFTVSTHSHVANWP